LTVETRFVVPDNQEARLLFGSFDEHLRWIEEEIPVRLTSRGNELTISGSAADREVAKAVLDRMLGFIRAGDTPTRLDVRRAVQEVARGVASADEEVVVVTHRGKPIRAKSPGQAAYVRAMRTHDIVFGIGPAGTGKTYLAMAMAVAALKARHVGRIILTRPAVEAGEKLGFLPGDLQDKVDPYLRPLYDALFDILGIEVFEKHRERGIVEVAPLAYMRGRTLDDSFVILDEAQNTTPEQMKMFLTRLGFGSKAVITGDITQVDLPRGQYSGLSQARTILAGVEGIAFSYLDEHDVVRHELVQKIIRAYEAAEQRAAEKEGG
jgi:phosphate starvation-inducible PhoH-like protein